MAAASLKNSLAGLYEDVGDLERARDTQLQVLRILRLNFGDDHPFVGVTLSNLARTERLDGKLEAAEDYGRQALALHLAIGSPTPNRASARYSLATTLAERGALEEALELFEDAARDHSEYLDPDDPRRARVAAEIEKLERRLGHSR